MHSIERINQTDQRNLAPQPINNSHAPLLMNVPTTRYMDALVWVRMTKGKNVKKRQHCLGNITPEIIICIMYIHPVQKIRNGLPRPRFMPRKPFRISDMKIVDGSQVDEGYTKKTKKKKTTLNPCVIIKITLLMKENKSWSFFMTMDFIKKMIFQYYDHQQRDPNVYQDDNDNTHVEYVKFEGIIQQICRQLNIKYLWYDQRRINQEDKKEKQREISIMHHIYSNSICTVRRRIGS
ncbi:hypothetical protein BDA99DRAFT_532244 [Phascolomyces articulosus]|uniref:Heterokaryon incompatibility domain-containing protein n=1 Tax=Phascolomyces articulosus TaxID=60185 RepID=A0AAD5KBQ1_9FUNG|nr:hypothetical protein BDA99DRAFT_532244 [Phascolomyces articulosus]